jgi:hypothetical protein
MWVGDGQDSLQAACERGQEQLIATDYLSAAATLAGAEATAWEAEDFDTLARLYMPLQEARRQIRLRCGEGAVVTRVYHGRLDDPVTSADLLLDEYPQGQLMVRQAASVAIAAAVRRRAVERRLYVEVLMAAFYPAAGQADSEGHIVLVPTVDARLPSEARQAATTAGAPGRLPPGCLPIEASDMPPMTPRGTPATFAAVSALWERLHAPFLAMAEAEPDPLRRMAAFRRTIEVDPACELAHQHLSNTARDLARQLARRRG